MTYRNLTSALGLAATRKRTVKNGKQFEKYFDLSELENIETLLVSKGTVYNTLDEMQKIVYDTLHQTKKIANYLKGNSTHDTAENIYNFLYQHVAYKKDNPLREQLRTPIATWADRMAGVDCDCYAIFVSSVLTNLKIAHSLRMVAFGDDFQHVYVVIQGQKQNIVIDPVVDKFNRETPYTEKYDYPMKITMLSGVNNAQQQCPETPLFHRLRRYVDTEQVLASGLVPTKEFLTASNIPFQSVISDKGGACIVTTPAGARKLATIITPLEAQNIKALVGNPTTCTCNTSPTASPYAEQIKFWPSLTKSETEKAAEQTPTVNTLPATPEEKTKTFSWWWVALGVGAYILLAGDEEKKGSNNGLNGIKKHNKKHKTIRI